MADGDSADDVDPLRIAVKLSIYQIEIENSTVSSLLILRSILSQRLHVYQCTEITEPCLF